MNGIWEMQDVKLVPSSRNKGEGGYVGDTFMSSGGVIEMFVTYVYKH
jgi:hypothetical protein